MAWAFINDDRVVKIESDITEDQIDEVRHLYQVIIDITEFSRQPKVGWIYNKGVLMPDIQNVTPRQIRQALILSGISIEMIDGALDSLPEPTRSLAKAEWEYSIAFERNRPLVKSVAIMLGWNDEQLDNLWILAKSL